METILIIDDNEAFRNALIRSLSPGFVSEGVGSHRAAVKRLSPPPDAVLLDIRLDESDPLNRDGIDILQLLRRDYPDIPVLMITAHGDVETAVECMQLGAVDFIQKPRATIQEIKGRLARALENARIARRVSELEHEIQIIEPRKIVGKSPLIEDVKRFIGAVAKDGNVTVLIRGETGTGKELVARAIHASGDRTTGPFVPVVLNALHSQTLEAEIFGYEPGAFTDARKRHVGYLEKAHRGVLFLDEIGELDPGLQIKLLRFLEEREFQRLGSTHPVRVDVQIVVATNADLEQKMQEGTFRKDLYFRLNDFQLELPPLRHHAEDIPLLADHFLDAARHQGKRIAGISGDALKILQHYSWPGNVRQFKSAIDSSIIWAGVRKHTEIEVDDLPADLRNENQNLTARQGDGSSSTDLNVEKGLARTELQLAERALRKADGRITDAWHLLGYNDRFTFSRRIRRILDRHPEIADEFPYIRDAFHAVAK